MKILVTGATGFIGRHIVNRLLQEDHEVTLMVNELNHYNENYWELFPSSYATSPNVELISYSIGDDPSQLDTKNSEIPFDAVIHTAWSGLKRITVNPYLSMDNLDTQLIAQYRFIRRLIELGHKNIIITGTCFEYDFHNHPSFTPHSVDEITNPITPYAIAKDTLHKMLRCLQKETDFKLTWARLFYVYGLDKNCGQRPGGLCNSIHQAIERKDKTFNVTSVNYLNGDGPLLDFVEVNEVACQLINLVDAVFPTQVPDIVNICSGLPQSVANFARYYVSKLGADISINEKHRMLDYYEPMEMWGKKYYES